MNARERFLSVMNFEKPDRLPFWEFMGFWPETIDRWHNEGLPENVSTEEYFGFDHFEFMPVDFNFVPAFERVIIEEDEDTRIVRDESGRTKKEFKYGSAMPHHIEFPIKTRTDFLELKERLDSSSPQRYPANFDSVVERYRNRDYPIGLISRGFFAFGRDFMSFEDLMVAFAEQPEWMEEMMDFHLDFLMRLWEKALNDVEVDMVYLGEDMAYKTSPMISPGMVTQMMLPRYKKLTGFLKNNGVKNIILDSDGDIRSLVPIFLEGGLTGVLPIEHNASCDPVDFRNKYPGLQMIGGLSKQAIALGGKSMEDEVSSKAGKLVSLGGYIPGFDHSVHPDTSLEIYKQYLDIIKNLGCKL
ncbi:MAG: hypothetical protein NT118_05125 [Lentisphaerae bacterium]|nr:hypothetical protein [Lentisphaerota bacterium]